MRAKAWLALVLFSVGLSLWANSFHIHAKATLAQTLIARSWARTTQGTSQKPWFWADTWPVARLRFMGREYYVLAGGHGSALAFGPGLMDGSVNPGEPGVSVIAGHRDTHFAFLGDVSEGAILSIQGMDRSWSAWEVRAMTIEDTRVSANLTFDGAEDLLVLVTCYPLDAVDPGGPLRLVVVAERKRWG